MVHARVSDKYIYIASMYTTDNIFLVLLIKNLVNQDDKKTGSWHVDTKALNMRHHSKNPFWSILVGIPPYQKGYLIYVPSTQI